MAADLTRQLADIAFAGLTDEECLWEPAPGAFTVRPNADGGWTVDWTDAKPDEIGLLRRAHAAQRPPT